MTTHITDTQKQTIRIALATWEGWERREIKFLPDGTDIHETVWWPTFEGEPNTNDHFQEHCRISLPNYPASLDACHAVEVKLTDEEHSAFRYSLREVIKWNERDFNCYRKLVSASAEHRALALYLSLNLGELGD